MLSVHFMVTFVSGCISFSGISSGIRRALPHYADIW